MANINGLNINGDVIETSPLKGLFTVPTTINVSEAQFDIDINWISQEKEKLQIDVFLAKSANLALVVPDSNSSYIIDNTEDKVTFKGEKETEFSSYYLVSFSSSTMQRICKIIISPNSGGSVIQPGVDVEGGAVD